MSEELETLKAISHRLEKAQIPYMITGSVAMSFYATPRMTRDIDVVIELGGADAPRMVDIFKADFYIDLEMVLEAIRGRGIFNIIDNHTGVKVDFVVRKSESYRKVEFERRRKVSVGEMDLWLVSPEDLILSKLVWAKDGESEIQLRDVKNLLGRKEGLDFDYLETWAGELDVSALYTKVKT